jgi:hypothetical protein
MKHARSGRPAAGRPAAGQVTATAYAHRSRRPAFLLAILACALASSLALCGSARADAGPRPATAVTQDLLAPVSGLSVIWHGKPVSALPFRIRLLDQASPLAYSLDIRRPAAYGDSWTGISLGRADNPADRSISATGIADPVLAEAIARGDAPSGRSPALASSDQELAARQIAIWSATNSIVLTPQTVPDAALRRRARQLLAGANTIQVPLQPAFHSVQIFIRQTTANNVQLAVTLGVDPNTSLTDVEHIDLYLDGVRCPILTQAQTHIERRSDGTYHAGTPKPLDPKTHSIEVAEVNLDRNTKVVDATADWVNVNVQPGLVMGGTGAAPPLVTAEPATLNFTTTTRLDPSDYTNPEQLLSNVGTAFLTTLHGWLVWVVLVVALYLITRAGRVADAAILWPARRKRRTAPRVSPAAVEVEAATMNEAIQAGLVALNLTNPEDVVVTVVHTAQHSPPGTGSPARVRLTRCPNKGS